MSTIRSTPDPTVVAATGRTAGAAALMISTAINHGFDLTPTEVRSLIGTERVRQGARLGFVVRHEGDAVAHSFRVGADSARHLWQGGGYWTWLWIGGHAPQRGATEVLRSALIVDDTATVGQTFLQLGLRVDAVDGRDRSERYDHGAPPAPRAQLGSRAGPVSARGWAARRFTHLDVPVAALTGGVRRDEVGLHLGVDGLDEALGAWAQARWTDHRGVPFVGGAQIDLERLHTEVGGRAHGAWLRTDARWAHVGGLAGGTPLDDGSLARFKDELDLSAGLRALGADTPLWLSVGRSWRLEPLGVVVSDPSWDQVVPVSHAVRSVALSHEREAGPVRVQLGAEVAELRTGVAPRLAEQWVVVQSPVQPLPPQDGWRGRLWLEVSR